MQPNPSFVLEFSLALIVFAVIALLMVNFPKVGKPLALFVIAALSVRAIGAFQS